MNSGPTFAEFFANWSIFRDAVLTGGIAGALLGFLGVQIVLRRMVFAASAIAQAAALGVALSFWVPAAIDPLGHAAGHLAAPGGHMISSVFFEPVLWAIGASLLATLVFIANPVKLHLTRESVLGVVFLASGAGAVIIGDRISQETHDLAAILFGSAVVVQRSDLVLIAIAAVVLLGIHVMYLRPLLFVAYDPIAARVQGLPTRRLNAFVFLAVGVSVALGTRALGALPVFAFSVLPAMAALAMTSNIGVVFGLATAFGALSGVAGYALSFRAELPVGATQAAVAVGLLALAIARRAVARLMVNVAVVALVAAGAVAVLGAAGCVGGRYATKADDQVPANASTAIVLERVAAERQGKHLDPAAIVDQLRSPAMREAVSVSRGDISLATAAHKAAIAGVAIVGRHIWTFATDCADAHQFHPPPLALEQHDLLMNAGAVAGPNGRVIVVLMIAEPGSSSLRADSMGGGPGGTNPSPETYAHPATAVGNCGEKWPTSVPPPL